jgi:hypothetical protein
MATDGPVSYPLGADASCLLIYARNGRDGGADCRADQPEPSVDHYIDESLFPNWSGEAQARPFYLVSGELVLRTPPMRLDYRTTVVNELAGAREAL